MLKDRKHSKTMTENELDKQTISTKRTDYQTERVLIFGARNRKKAAHNVRLIATGQGIEPYHSPVEFSHRKHLHSKTYWHNLSRGMACPPISFIKHPKFVKNPEITK
jgi:hypothetical protein